MMYSRTYLSKEELQQLLVSHVDLLEINRILSAYDMADMAYAEKKSLNGSPYFFHTSRVCKILVFELNIYEPDMLISALLHDIFETTDIAPEIIEYNYGSYVAYLLSLLKENYENINDVPVPFHMSESTLKNPSEDYLIICLAEHLDNFRSLEVSPLFNPVNYILNTVSILFPIAEVSSNEKVKFLLTALKQERNKILG